MRALRRNDFSPRLEMTPLIDVVFLLLTFFIYSLVVMWPVQVMPVAISALTAQSGGRPGPVRMLVLDRSADLYFDQRKTSLAELDGQLAELAASEPGTEVFLVMEADGTANQGPMLVEAMARVSAAGLKPVVVTQKRGGQ